MSKKGNKKKALNIVLGAIILSLLIGIVVCVCLDWFGLEYSILGYDILKLFDLQSELGIAIIVMMMLGLSSVAGLGLVALLKVFTKKKLNQLSIFLSIISIIFSIITIILSLVWCAQSSIKISDEIVNTYTQLAPAWIAQISVLVAGMVGLFNRKK